MEENRPDHLDKLFTDALRSFEDRPAKEVWERIEQGLDGDRRRVFFPIFRPFSLVAASLIALCIALGIFYHAGHKTTLAHKSEISHDKSNGMGSSTVASSNSPLPGLAYQMKPRSKPISLPTAACPILQPPGSMSPHLCFQRQIPVTGDLCMMTFQP